MRAVIKVEGVRATFDGSTWTSSNKETASFLNGYRWRGSRHSEHGLYGSHAVAVAEDIGAEVVSVEDTPTDSPDVEDTAHKAEFATILNWKKKKKKKHPPGFQEVPMDIDKINASFEATQKKE